MLHSVLLVADWVVACAWTLRTIQWLHGFTLVPDLWDSSGEEQSLPTLSVIVPARNEEKSIEACLRSLAGSGGLELEVIAVDDRSTDQTGSLMDRAAGDRMQVIHIDALPDGWMGKTHAMAAGAGKAKGEWLLFTDGDLIFHPRALELAVRYAERENADHVILYPTMLFESFGERMMLSYLHAMSIWGMRPWKVSDPKAKRDYIGIGAFNLVRRSTYDAVGGWEALRMEVLEDLRMGFTIKRAGFLQHAVFGRDLIRIRWAEGAFGVVNNMTKNLFAIFRFRLVFAGAASCGVFGLCLLPFLIAGLGMAFIWPLGVLLSALGILYARYHRLGLPHAFFVLTFPVGAALFLFALVQSVAVTIGRKGVVWRGTFYPLAELRRHAGPLR